MKNNPFVIFVTAFLVVMGSGLAIAAIGGPSGSTDRLEESSFAVDFGGEIETDTEAKPIETTAASAPREVKTQGDTAVEKESVEQSKKVEEKAESEPKQEAPKGETAEEEIAKGDEPEEVDESTWIEVLAPTDGTVFEHKEVAFEGKAEPGAKVYAGEYQADINDGGVWRIVLFLAPGQQTVQFKAIDPAGNRATDSVTVSLKTLEEKPKSFEFTVNQKYVESHERFEKFYGTGTPGMGVVARSEFGVAHTRVADYGEWRLPVEFSGLTETKTFPITISTTEGFSGTYWFTYVAKAHEFSANQKYGSCSENPPYDVFWGTGIPGSVVEIGSPYGSARIEVGEGGWWEKKVFFEAAPVGETFEVVVGDSLGNVEAFTFTRTEGEPK